MILLVSLFGFKFQPNTYDSIYDCGLFHHLAPHRRLTYLEIIKKALKKEVHFGIVCFDTIGALGTPDWDVYKEGSLKKGIDYSENRLKEVFNNDFKIVNFRKMKKINQPAELFWEDFLWVSLMKIRD